MPPEMSDNIMANACAWPGELGRQFLNVAYPDAAATYFGMPYRVPPGGKLVIHGTYPFTRYFSYSLYDLTAAPTGNLYDTEIQPDPGSVNPFLNPQAPTNLAQRQYTVEIDPEAVPGTPNTIAGNPNGIGIVIYRVYVPDTEGAFQGGVPLPTVAVEDANGTRQPLGPCTPDQQAHFRQVLEELLARVSPVPIGPRARDELCPCPDTQFVPSGPLAQHLFPNPNNKYLCIITDWSPGRILVLRAKAPTFPNTRAGEPLTKPSQLRFWSISSAEFKIPFPVVDGKADFQMVVGADGYFTVVVSKPEDRPSNATEANGINWLPWGDTSVPGIIIFRNMLPSPDFHQAVQDAPRGSTPEQTRTIMGPYYPTAAYSDKARFESGGVEACLP